MFCKVKLSEAMLPMEAASAKSLLRKSANGANPAKLGFWTSLTEKLLHYILKVFDRWSRLVDQLILQVKA